MIDNIKLNFNRLCKEEYTIEKIFQDNDSYGWPGDWEGRALLAFCCHYEINKNKVPALSTFIAELKKHTNKNKYLGKVYDGITVDEQQLSGHSWYLRGLLKYYELFNDESVMEIAKSTVYNLYLPILNTYDKYPLNRIDDGGVGGYHNGIINNWKVSSDVGCAFMCVDGLSHYYSITKDEKVKEFLDKIIDKFLSIDIVNNKFQTHASLSCMRGILSVYKATVDTKYLEYVEKLFDLYVKFGMTKTYENFNWFKREETWTEPCAVVDSFILATELFNITHENCYLVLARRIWFNGLQFCQRENGGAGPNSCVTREKPILKISMYEAPFCCSMRYAEGLLEYSKNEKLFKWNKDALIVEETDGRKYIDDKLLVKVDGNTVPIFSCNEIEEDKAMTLKLNVLFN